MSLSDAFALLVLFLGGLALWRHAAMGRKAYLAAHAYTHERGLLLLDQTIVLKRLRLQFSSTFWVAVVREYQFEFATQGDARYRGTVCLLGERVREIRLPVYKTVEPRDRLT